MAGDSLVNWKIFLVLFGASVLGIIFVMPYVLELQAELLAQVPLPLPLVVAVSIVQSCVLFFVIILFGLWFTKRVPLGVPYIEAWLESKNVNEKFKSVALISCLLCILVAIAIFVGDLFFRYTGLFSLEELSVNVVWWQGFLASFYDGINEEILMRLFLVSMFVWIFSKVIRDQTTKLSNLVTWISIILASVVFGLGHLPVTQSLVEITPVVVARAVILNGIGGIVFGWLYWKKGLESAMISHFSADIVLLVIVPFIFG